ncbi:MAG TPA: CBS domain-containing protein, partial [Candidatus Norongarragalinales archaeon]|nr:CBS domain-containing protein [Candidatus Norongarragalinales archaeon]
MEKPLILEGEETLSKAFGQLNRKNDDYFFVTLKGKFAGVVDSRTLRDFYGDPSETKAKNLMVKAPVLNAASDGAEMVSKLLSTRTKALAVVDKKGKIEGAVTRWSALDLLRGMPEVHGKKVREAMTEPVLSIPENASISQARHLMKEKNVFRLVVTNLRGEATGVLSAFDMSTKVKPALKERRRQYYYFPTPKLRMDNEPVKLVMSSGLHTIRPNEGILEAVRLFQKHGVSSLVVAEGAIPKGMLTLRDVLQLCTVKETPNVSIVGLRDEEGYFKESLKAMAARYLEKISRRVPLQPDDEL